MCCIQVILFEIDCAIFYTNLHELFCQFISWTNWVNSGKFMDNCWISCQVMADMKKVYDDLIIINLYYVHCRSVVPGGAGGAMAHPDFGRSVYPSFNQGEQIMPTWLLLTPPDFQTFRRPWKAKEKKVNRNDTLHCKFTNELSSIAIQVVVESVVAKTHNQARRNNYKLGWAHLAWAEFEIKIE